MTLTRDRAAGSAPVVSTAAAPVRGRLRRAVPLALIPLALLACALASSPWLRAFPGSVIGAPLFGAAVLSVLVPVVVFAIGVHRLWLTALTDLALLLFFELLVVLHNLTGSYALWDGLTHGPSELLSYALPLVSPRSLLVAPVALCWICGAIIGECLARGWSTVVPYITLLVTFGLSYAATARGIAGAGTGHHYDTLLGAALLLVLLLLRTTQAWVNQDDGATSTQAGGTLPLRGLLLGVTVAGLLAAAVVGVARTPAFHGPPTTPKVVPPLNRDTPFTPISFVSGLRPADPRSTGKTLFTLSVDRPSSNYVSLANLDTYDGDSWSFARTFAPSGGVIPADPVLTLRPSVAPVTQQYSVLPGPLTTVPWMPYVERAQKVSGLSVDVDAATGMITPVASLFGGESYSVRSTSTPDTLLTLPGSPSIDGFGGSTIPNDVRDPLAQLVQTFSIETGVSSSAAVPFLKAVAGLLRRSHLAGPPAAPSATAPPTRPSRPARSSRPAPGRTRASATASTSSAGTSATSGGTSFADVLTSIQVNHTATPEQFATLMCLVARSVHIPARIGTGFRIETSELTAGHVYNVTTADAWTWVEIPVAGAGWVVLDPSPTTRGTKDTRQTESAQPKPPQTSAPPTNGLSPAGAAPSRAALPPSPPAPTRHVNAVNAAVIVLLALVVLAVLVIAMLLGRKVIRSRRRRRSRDPRRRVLGAWQESLDVLQEAGLADLTRATSREVAVATADRFGDEPARQVRLLGDAANAAIFSPTSPVGPSAAEAAWRAHDDLRRTVRRQLTIGQRVGAQLRFHRAAAAPGAGPAQVPGASAGHDRPSAGRRRGRHTPSARARTDPAG